MKILPLLKSGLTVILYIMILSGCLPRTADAEDRDRDYDLNRDIILIVNGDDVGINKIYTDATIDAYKKGMISSASIIAPGHDAERAISILKKYPELEIGIHLTLTGGWKPLTSRETAPTLYNEDGTMWHTEDEASYNVKPEHAETEWEAQIKKVLDAGLKLSHLDSHMGCYLMSPGLFNAAFNLSKKYNIPIMAPYIQGIVPEVYREKFILKNYTGIYRLAGVEETLENRTGAYFAKFRNFIPGVYYIFTHPGWISEEGSIGGDIDLRVNEYKFWTNMENRKKLEEMGCFIMGFSAVKKEFGNIFNLK